MKEQLIEMTGLSGRVIRVWFQNKRCKDKKRQIAKIQSKVSCLPKILYNRLEIVFSIIELLVQNIYMEIFNLLNIEDFAIIWLADRK